MNWLARVIFGLGPLLLVACDRGDEAPPRPIEPGLVAPDPQRLTLMGTGAMTPLAQALAAEWKSAGEPLPIVVEASAGTTGGVQATAEGAIDLGMVSRPLRTTELALGLTVVPIARDAVVLAANGDVSIDSLSSSEVVELYKGAPTFHDGSCATVLLRDRDESANEVLERSIPGLREAREQAYGARRFRVLLHDDAMIAALASTRCAIGVIGLSAIAGAPQKPKVLSLGGVAPTREAVATGTWPATRELAFVARPDRAERLRRFLEFARSPQREKLLEHFSLVPSKQVAP